MSDGDISQELAQRMAAWMKTRLGEPWWGPLNAQTEGFEIIAELPDIDRIEAQKIADKCAMEMDGFTPATPRMIDLVLRGMLAERARHA